MLQRPVKTPCIIVLQRAFGRESMRESNMSWYRAVVILAVFAAAAAAADCRNPDFKPYDGDVQVVCWIDWEAAGIREAALFTPLGNMRWTGWIHSSGYFIQPVMMTETSNSCAGLALVGRNGDFLYRIFAEADTFTLLVDLEHTDEKRNDRGFGECKILDMSATSADVE